MKKYFITTSIAYTNSSPHIGFALELIQADLIARLKRKEKEVFFLTGTDEHGSKIYKASLKAKKEPQEFVDEIAKEYEELLEKLNISHNLFIRTTDKEIHYPGVEKLWNKLKEEGDLYKKKYKGLYCLGCEAFVSKRDLIEGKCPNHLVKPEEVSEENYFFRLSKYKEEIEKAIKSDRVKIIPEERKREMLNFLKEGLDDVSFSRPKEKVKWGIPVPGDESQRIYVWCDALVNYLSGAGYGRKEKEFNSLWPTDIHFIGKDILRFHSIIWIGMLLSSKLELPQNIFVHGFITSKGQKMSKTLGNVVNPFHLIDEMGSDPVRYFFLREAPPGKDSDFTREKFLSRYHGDLSDGLGNLISRTVGLSKRANVKEISAKEEIKRWVKETKEESFSLAKDFRFNEALERIWLLIHKTDSYIEEKKPWEKKEDQKEVISNLLFICLSLSEIIEPFLPETGERIKGAIERGEGKPLFPRLE